MEFHVPYLKMFKEKGWETAVAAKNDYDDPADCRIPYCDRYYEVPFARNPIAPANLKAYKELARLIDAGEYDIIHCHTPVGGALARLAAQRVRNSGCAVVYTAHGFHFYKGASIVNWMLYYPVEKLLARMTDVLITINKEDYCRAGSFKAGRICYVPGIGIDVKKFKHQGANAQRNLRAELCIPEEMKVLLSVGEINRNKNHRIVIQALPDLDCVYYVVCGSGPMIHELKTLAAELHVSDRVLFAGYRNDLPDFYQMADCFVFPSYREGLPVALMEAMASGLVCVASKNRGTDDLLDESRLKFDASDKKALKEKIRIALSDDCSDEISRNTEKLREYDISNVLTLTEEIYESALQDKHNKI